MEDEKVVELTKYQMLVKELMGFHETSWAHLPTFQQDRITAAVGRMQGLLINGIEDISRLGASLGEVVQNLWDCRDYTGEKATAHGWGIMPESVRMGERCEKGVSVGAPEVFMVKSTTTARCALALVVPNELDPDTGYDRYFPSRIGAQDGALFLTLEIFDSADEALEALRQFRQDWRTWCVIGNESARVAERLKSRWGSGADF